MSRYVMLRVVQGIITLFLASVVIFLLARLTGNPLDVLLPEAATEKEYADMAKYLGLDKPLYEQYAIFVAKAAHGDFGKSLRYRLPVMEFILDRAPATIKLAVSAAVISFILAIPVGVLAATRRNKWQDSIAKGFAILGQSAPNFWVGILLIEAFAVFLGWLPAGGYGGVKYWILPSVTLGWFIAAGTLRMTRSAMLDVLDTDFVRLARIKGVSQKLVIWKHALRNALIPVVTFSSTVSVHLLTGSVVVETVFAWPGIGRLSYEAVMYRDFPLIQGLVMTFVGLFIAFNLAVDVLYVYLDPRIRYVEE